MGAGGTVDSRMELGGELFAPVLWLEYGRLRGTSRKASVGRSCSLLLQCWEDVKTGGRSNVPAFGKHSRNPI